MKVHTYHGKHITVTWDGVRCLHAAECLRSLPGVFDLDQRPWVQPDRADPAAVADAVMLCPTGALHFDSADGSRTEPGPGQNVVQVKPNGPLYIHGNVVILNPDQDVILEDTRLALCRCGQSRHKPFCDNTHRHTGFRDPGRMIENKLVFEDTPQESGRLTICANRNGSLRLKGPVTIRFAGGAEVFGARGSLCRCGQSKNKPFCDGTHKEIGFTA